MVWDIFGKRGNNDLLRNCDIDSSACIYNYLWFVKKQKNVSDH